MKPLAVTRAVLILFLTLLCGAVFPAGTAAQEGPWWEVLDDGTLGALIDEALSMNPDLMGAVQRIAQAEASSLRSRSAILPTLSLDVQGSVAPLSGLGFQFGGLPIGGDPTASRPSLFYTGSGGVTARDSAPHDVRLYRAVESSRLRAAASRGDSDAIAVALATQVAEAYLDAVSAREQRAIIEQQVTASQQLADVTLLRYEGGQATALDVLQQRQQLATARANLPLTEASLRVALERLHALLARDALAALPNVPDRLPSVPGGSVGAVGAGTVGASGAAFAMFDRPDIRGADARLQASLRDASGAQWSRLPNLNLSFNTGLQFFRVSELATQSTWGGGLSFSVPLFDGFDRSGRIQEAVAGAGAAEASLRQVEALAVSEVRSATAQQEEQTKQLLAFQEQLDASTLAYNESRRRYLVGIASFLDVLNALNGMQQAELNVVRTKRNVLGSWIQLQQATGGGWTRGLGRE
jgi:multidrug efflux system outer membrane protein